MGIIQDLKEMRQNRTFPRYMEYVRLPKFKDVEDDTQIDFNFPLTVFIGGNGTRKSSVLKAIQGCPKGESPSKYWFSTRLDPIPGGSKDKKEQSIIHAYKDSQGNMLENLKIRADKKGRSLDYWETSSPRKKYGMQVGDRHEPLDKHVEYLNFRSLLPAFDKCFFYSGRANVQDYIRNKSPQLNNVIDTGEVVKVRGKPQNSPRVTLTTNELKSISEILGRQYKEGVYIKHRFFDGEGDTVVLNTSHYKYSEAFAGSGEVAIAVLVHIIENAPDSSLIILDEPEVSLHPEAQRNLRNYLLKKIREKKHQIIISTHSPFIAEALPKEAIKVFRISPETGQTEVLTDISPEEAFTVIGYVSFSKKKVVWVEDVLAKTILDQFMAKEDPSRQVLFEVRVAGSDTQMYKDIVHACNKTETKNYYYIIDGDNRPNLTSISVSINNDGLCKVSSIPSGDMNEKFLGAIVKKQSREQDPSRLGLNRGGDPANLLESYKIYLEFMETNVSFLPQETPEKMIWSDDVAEKKLQILGLSARDVAKALKAIGDTPEYKKKFSILSKIIHGPDDSRDILALQKEFITVFINENGQDAQKIKSRINYMATNPV